jgi:type III restriction enzyme
MDLLLQKELPHQQIAVDAVREVFNGVHIDSPKVFYANPIIDLTDTKIQQNIAMLQKDIPACNRYNPPIDDCLNLDIKMETGTGKTYVYAKTIFELNKYYGINKFIIVVPSLAIKAGTAQFLTDGYSRRHFADSCGYGKEIEVCVLEASKKTKKGRTYFPVAVSEFVKGSLQNNKKIFVLLVNMQLITSNKKSNGKDAGLLWRDDYDYGAEGFYRPFDAIRATHPFVIIDEPHRFSREQTAYTTIKSNINPQCIIRYGATFPEIVTGKGKNKVVTKDYLNLLYDLDACKAFNQGLIKGVAKEHFEPTSSKNEKVKVVSTNNKDNVEFQYIQGDGTKKSYTLKKNDSLSIIHEAFEGITISGIYKSAVEFSNGIIKNCGEELNVDIYMTSYQEQMIRLALQRHFETERSNFSGRRYKIKTLALFFIDDITSYRQSEDGKETYLLKLFERLLREQINNTISNLDENENEYKNYLEASLNNISACHAGYFSQDNSDSDEEIAKEVNIILHNKKQLLSLKNKNGSYNTLRFLFSKWTLKEGWDNPNVFTIAKLRSSGSEISKLQEVGRGLRLPVDESGNRISNEDFVLNYIVDFTEQDFAQKLVDEINSEIPQAIKISEDKLNKVAEKYGIGADDLFIDLLTKHYIDRKYNINDEHRNQFFAEYPEFNAGINANKVRDLNKDKVKPIKIRKAAYNEIKELWQTINKKYLLFYDNDLNKDLDNVVLSILEQGVFADVVMSSRREVIRGNDSRMVVETDSGVQYSTNNAIPYGAFLKRISNATNIPVDIIHKAICAYVEKYGEIKPEYFNDNSVAAFCRGFAEWKNNNLQGRFSYKPSNKPVGATALTNIDGTPLSTIAQGRIGIKIEPGTPSNKYLYDTFAYDSPLERENIITNIDEVIVYGKIPRSSIAIPTITGGTYSPDFMYVVKNKDGSKQLNVIVETKDVEGKTDLRGTEAIKIKCAEVFFDTLKSEGYNVNFKMQLGNKQMRQILNEIAD